jgi:PAS domain S-box-containing protein
VTANDRTRAEFVRLRARIATLEQLLEVYERSVIEQSDKLYAEQERMRFQKTLLECQGEASIDGILSVSVDGGILFANRQLSEMWGIAPVSVGSKSYEEVLRAMSERTSDPGDFLERAARVHAGEEHREEISLADGRTFDRFTAPIRSRDGEHLGRVWHFRDISAFKKIDRMKDEFISSVSHELRTPMTSIRGSLDLMVNSVTGELPSEAMSLAKIAQGNCERLVRLINDVLDIEKMEAGRMELRLQPIALEALLERSVESMRPFGEQLGVGFRLASSAPGARVRADPDRLAQVMDNLLSNAAKFSPAGGTVHIDLARQGTQLRVSVTDLGPGIPREFQDRVFEKFAQVGTESARHKGGTGLGLSIAKAIVERLGGTIGFSSEPGGETHFHFDLPESDLPEGAPGEEGGAPR